MAKNKFKEKIAKAKEDRKIKHAANKARMDVLTDKIHKSKNMDLEDMKEFAPKPPEGVNETEYYQTEYDKIMETQRMIEENNKKIKVPNEGSGGSEKGNKKQK